MIYSKIEMKKPWYNIHIIFFLSKTDITLDYFDKDHSLNAEIVDCSQGTLTIVLFLNIWVIY